MPGQPAASSPSYGFQESAASDTALSFADPFVNNANFSIYGPSYSADSGTVSRDSSATASSSQEQGMKQGGVDVGPGTGNLAGSEGGSTLIVWITTAGIVVSVILALVYVSKATIKA
jgi:hypothetical protein